LAEHRPAARRRGRPLRSNRPLLAGRYTPQTRPYSLPFRWTRLGLQCACIVAAQRLPARRLRGEGRMRARSLRRSTDGDLRRSALYAARAGRKGDGRGYSPGSIPNLFKAHSAERLTSSSRRTFLSRDTPFETTSFRSADAQRPSAQAAPERMRGLPSESASRNASVSGKRAMPQAMTAPRLRQGSSLLSAARRYSAARAGISPPAFGPESRSRLARWTGSARRQLRTRSFSASASLSAERMNSSRSSGLRKPYAHAASHLMVGSGS